MNLMRALLTVCVVVGGALASAPALQAAEMFVACDANALIAAIKTAEDNGAGKDTLHLAPDCVYTLTRATDEGPTTPTGLPQIRSTIEILGNGAIIERSKAPNAPPFRIFFVQLTGVLTLQSLTIRNGRTVDGLPQRVIQRRNARPGGGILNSGTVTLIDCTITGNTTGNGADYDRVEEVIDPVTGERELKGAGNGGDGGGIFNRGVLTLINSTVSGNTTGHGGVGVIGGDGGDGAGLINSNENGVHKMTLINTTVSGNTTGNGGAGVNNGTGGPGGYGGGIFNNNQTIIINSTITDNAVGRGGIGDKANGEEGKGGGIRLHKNLVLRHSIVAVQRSGKDCDGTDPEAYIYSLDSDNSCQTILPPGSPLPPPIRLGPLQLNGGTTQTHRLLCDSPAIDAGDPAGCTDADGNLLLTDQRGVPRPQGEACDVGAFEVQAGADLSLTQTIPSGLVGIGQQLTYRFTVTNQGPAVASGVTLASSLSENASVTAVHASQGACTATEELSCTLGELACGQEATVEVILTTTESGELENTALVQSLFPNDPATDNNTHTEIVHVGSFVSHELPSDARVVVELLSAPEGSSQAIFTGSPPILDANIVASGCNTGGLTAGTAETVLFNTEKSHPGCRLLLDAVPSTQRIDAFPAGTLLTFSDRAGWTVDPTERYPGVLQITWRPDDASDNALVIVVRFIADIDPPASCPHCNSLDTDGDGLWDDWEQYGIDTDGDGDAELDLPALGADPNKPDVFVEIDYMDCAVEGSDCTAGHHHSHKPKPEAIRKITEAFENNNSARGSIALHIYVVDEALPHRNVLPFASDGGTTFATLKAEHFGLNNPRAFAFHYGIFTHQQKEKDTSSGQADVLGNDFIVSLGGWNTGGVAELDGDDLPDADVGTVQQQASTLMHELGHNFGLDHGGGEQTNRKPNYPSIMNYAFHPVGVTSAVGAETENPEPGKLTYSAGLNAPLDEADLVESSIPCTNCEPFNTRYVCPYHATCPVPLEHAVAAVQTASSTEPIDWNCNGVPEIHISADLNGNCESQDFLTDFDDWRNLRMDFQAAAAFADSGHSSAGSFEKELDTVALNTWLTSAKDSFMREGAENTNEGENPFLLIQSGSRVVLGFDLSQFPSPGVTSAKLRLTLAQEPRNGEVAVQVYRVHEPFTFSEGNGSNWRSNTPEIRNLGNGEGVTWKCAVDAEVGNQQDDCENPWDGGNAALVSLSGSIRHERSAGIKQSVELDVTADVQAAISEGKTEIMWLLKKKERGPGQIIYFAKEGVKVGAEVRHAPSLFLKFD